MNEFAIMFNTNVVQYRVERLNSLEEQLLQKAQAALSNETIRRGETWQVMLDQMPISKAPEVHEPIHCSFIAKAMVNYIICYIVEINFKMVFFPYKFIKKKEFKMTPEENYRNWRKYEVSHAKNPIIPDLYGVVDELSVAKESGNKELQEKTERGEVDRYSPSEFNDSRNKTKKREREIKISWRNTEEANRKWKEQLKSIKI